MARPKTKGSMIPVRLRLDVDEYVRARADAHGETPGDYIARTMERAMPLPTRSVTITSGRVVPALHDQPGWTPNIARSMKER